MRRQAEVHVAGVLALFFLAFDSRFPLRPIRSDDELARAINVVNSLVDQDERNQDEDDYLEVLGDLVEKYETEHHPIPPVSDADMLRHLIEARGTTQAAVAAETGIAISTVSEILSGKRGLNRRHIESFRSPLSRQPGRLHRLLSRAAGEASL